MHAVKHLNLSCFFCHHSLSCLALGSLQSALVLVLLLYLAERSLGVVLDLFELYSEGVALVRDGAGECKQNFIFYVLFFDVRGKVGNSFHKFFYQTVIPAKLRVFL